MSDEDVTLEEQLALEYAYHLVDFGVPVFLAKPAMGSDGAWDATGGTGGTGYWLPSGWQESVADARALEGWRRGWAVCAVTGHGIDVLDVDPRNGGDRSLPELEAEGLVPRSYGRQRTPSGGSHDFVAGLGVGKRLDFRPGVDVLAGDSDGKGRGFAFLAPTEKVSKATGEISAYEWETPPDLAELALVGADDSGVALAEAIRLGRASTANREPREIDFSTLPTETEVRKAVAVLAKAEREVREAAEGSRNELLIRHLPTLYQFVLGGCLAETTADEQMQEAATFAGIGAEYNQVRKSAWKIANREGADRPRVDTAADDFGTVPADDFGTVPAGDLFDATPTLRTIRQAAYSRLVGAPSLLCYVLARVLAEVPPNVQLPPVVGGKASLNLGIAVVGGSGAGKSALLSVSRELMGLTGAWQEDIERSVGSGEGLVQQFLKWDSQDKVHELIQDPRRILTVDEIDQLGATKNRNGATIAPTIRTALTGGPLGQANATAERNRHVPAGSYRLVLVLGVQPTRSDTLLDDADAGTPQRLVWVPAMDPDLPDYNVEWPGPLAWDLPRPLPSVIHYPEHIKEQVRAARRAQIKAGADPLAGHRLLTQLKVAAALALLHEGVAITDQWWELAGQVIEASMAAQEYCKRVLSEEVADRRRSAGVLDGIRAEGAAEYKDQRAVKAATAVWRKIAKHADGAKDDNDQRHEPGDGCTARCVSRALRDYADRDELRTPGLEHALLSDWIVEEDERWFPGDSRPA